MRSAGAGEGRKVAQSRYDSMTLASWAMWIALFAVLLRGFSVGHPTMYHAARFLLDLAATMLGFAGLRHLLVQRARGEGNPTALACGCFLTVYAMAAGVGVIFGNDMLLWTLGGILPFGTAICLALGDSRDMFARLWGILVRQLYVIVPFAFYVVVVVRPVDRATWFSNGDADGLGLLCMRALYVVPFLLPYVDRMRPRYAYLTAAAYLEAIALHIEGANRGAVLVYILGLPVLILLMNCWKGGFLMGTVRVFRPVGVLLLAVLPVANLAGEMHTDVDEYITDRLTETINRITTGSETDLRSRYEGTLNTAVHEFTGGESRGGELTDFLGQLEPADWLIGRGFGGTWVSTFWGTEWAMVHVGPAHLVLLGGLPLLLVFLYLLATAAWGFWGALRTAPEAMGGLAVLLTFTCGFIQHGALSDDPTVYLYWLCLGMGIALYGKREQPLLYRLRRQKRGVVFHPARAV